MNALLTWLTYLKFELIKRNMLQRVACIIYKSPAVNPFIMLVFHLVSFFSLKAEGWRGGNYNFLKNT